MPTQKVIACKPIQTRQYILFLYQVNFLSNTNLVIFMYCVDYKLAINLKQCFNFNWYLAMPARVILK